MSTRTQRTEAQVAYACDRTIEAASGRVVRLMPGRRDGQQSIGLPRRRYHLALHAMWWTPRSTTGRLTPAHCDFMVAEHILGQIVGAGDEDSLRRVVRLCRDGASHDTIREMAWTLAMDVLARGPST